MIRCRPTFVAVVLACMGCRHAQSEAHSGAQPGAQPAAQPGARPHAPTVAAPAAEATATLDVGAIAPDFGLVAADGATLRLADAVATGPVVVVFYRGDW